MASKKEISALDKILVQDIRILIETASLTVAKSVNASLSMQLLAGR